MGVSTDGILCYGFRIHNERGDEVEEDSPDWLKLPGDEDQSMEFEDFLAKLADLQKPDSFDTEKYDSDPVYAQTWSDYWAKKRNLKKEFGVTLVMHCSGEYPMWILAVEECNHSSSRGSPLSFGQGIEVKPEWREKLVVFCERAGIEFREPELLLCSYLG